MSFFLGGAGDHFGPLLYLLIFLLMYCIWLCDLVIERTYGMYARGLAGLKNPIHKTIHDSFNQSNLLNMTAPPSHPHNKQLLHKIN